MDTNIPNTLRVMVPALGREVEVVVPQDTAAIINMLCHGIKQRLGDKLAGSADMTEAQKEAAIAKRMLTLWNEGSQRGPKTEPVLAEMIVLVKKNAAKLKIKASTVPAAKDFAEWFESTFEVEVQDKIRAAAERNVAASQIDL